MSLSAPENASTKKSSKRFGAAPRRRTLWIGLALLAVAVWMFFLGILVGRGTAPVRFDIDRLEQELAALRETLKEKERQLLASTQRAESELGLTFFDDLKQSEEEGAVEFRTPPEPVETTPEPAGEPLSAPALLPAENFAPQSEALPADPEPQAPSPVSPEEASLPATFKPKKSLKYASFKATVSAPSVKKAADSGPPPPRSAPPAPQPATRKAPRGALTIQVSAVQDAGTAREMVTRLKSQGYDAHQSVARVPGKGLRYRIRVGRFTNSGEAQAVLRRLKGDNYDAMLVNR